MPLSNQPPSESLDTVRLQDYFFLPFFKHQKMAFFRRVFEAFRKNMKKPGTNNRPRPNNKQTKQQTSYFFLSRIFQ